MANETIITTAALNQAANAVSVNKIQLHSANPGNEGLLHVITGAFADADYAPAVNGYRDLSEIVDVDISAGQRVSHFSVWDGETFKYAAPFSRSPELYLEDGVARVKSARISFALRLNNDS